MKNDGFTLVELMVTLAVAAIVLTVAVPSFRELISNNRLAAQVNDFVSVMNLSRSEAVKRGIRVSVCASSNGNTCAGTWPQGWIVFTDTNGNCAIDAGVDTLLQVRGSLSSGNTFTAVEKDGSATTTCVGYVPSGFSWTTQTSDATWRDKDVIFTLCDPGMHKSRVLEFSKIGRLNKTDSTC